MTVSKEWLDTEIAERSKEPHRTMYSRTLLDALKELASRRAADEGAVTVEGWLAADCCLDGRIYFNHEGEMMIFSDAPAGPDRDKEVQAAVTIRRKP